MKDDLQQFRMFHAAMRLVTKSVDERGLELSDKVQSLLSDTTDMIWRVVRVNHLYVSLKESHRSCLNLLT